MTRPRKLKAKNGSQSDRIETRDFKVAIAQFAPVYLDKAASALRAIQIIQDAKKRGAELVAFVLAVGLAMPARDLPTELKNDGEIQRLTGDWLERGGSAIIGPDTRYVVEPVFDREELIVADLNLNEIDQEFMTFDASEHYSRPDVFTFETKAEQAVRT